VDLIDCRTTVCQLFEEVYSIQMYDGFQIYVSDVVLVLQESQQSRQLSEVSFL